MARSVLLFFILSSIVASTLSFCCDRKNIYSCCGRGPCNIFCCNCDGDSCQDKRDCSTAVKDWPGDSRRKRSLDIVGDDGTLKKFYSLDTNGDGGIDIDEAIKYTTTLLADPKYLNYDNASSLSMRKRRSVSIIEKEFTRMDTNGNGKIEKEEFDESLRK